MGDAILRESLLATWRTPNVPQVRATAGPWRYLFSTHGVIIALSCNVVQRRAAPPDLYVGLQLALVAPLPDEAGAYSAVTPSLTLMLAETCREKWNDKRSDVREDEERRRLLQASAENTPAPNCGGTITSAHTAPRLAATSNLRLPHCVWAPPAKDLAEHCMSKGTTDFFTQVDACWLQLHAPIRRSEQTPMPKPPVPKVKASYFAGRCLCDRHGLKVRNFVSALPLNCGRGLRRGLVRDGCMIPQFSF